MYVQQLLAWTGLTEEVVRQACMHAICMLVLFAVVAYGSQCKLPLHFYATQCSQS